ncbi:MAG TPA: isochorismatase family cysteine hydrolase [Phototrophicaceae bacterium]|nr:isochorismatase family cysteine hydrolase [Phototrophicaceae bacterium]
MMQFHFAPQVCALIVVDVQVDFCSPDGSTAKRGKPNTRMQALPDKINAFVKAIAGLGLTLVYAKSVISEERLAPNVRFFNEMKGIKRPTQEGSGGEEFYRLEIPADAIIVRKETSDPFTFTNLKHILEERQISTVLICGVRTEICVDATARKAFSEGYNVIVISDLVATRDSNLEDERYALRFIDAYVGFVMDSAQAKRVLQT